MSYNLGKILSVNRKGFYFILLKDFVDGNFDCKMYTFIRPIIGAVAKNATIYKPFQESNLCSEVVAVL
jgi:hypothetical protein